MTTTGEGRLPGELLLPLKSSDHSFTEEGTIRGRVSFMDSQDCKSTLLNHEYSHSMGFPRGVLSL